jgi:basic membrane protein A
MRERSGRPGSYGRLYTAAAATAAVAIVFAISACGSDSGGSSSGSSGGGSGGSGDKSAKQEKVVALLSGTTKDGGFSEGFYDGVEKSKAQNPGMTIRDSGPIESADAMVRQASAYAKQGYNLVFIIHGAFVSVVPQLAKRFPDTKFCGILLVKEEQLAKEPKNVCYFSPEQQIVSFMGGAAAALASKTHHVGSVAAIDFPALTEEVEGFHLGARCMDPKVKYSEIYTGDFNDPSKARAAAATLYSGDVDVLFGALDAAVQGLYAAAEAGQNRWVVPEYIDSYAKAPKVVLTSAVYGLPEIAETMIKDDIAGKLKQSYVFNGQADGDKWSLAPFRDHENVIGADNIAKLKDLEQKVKSGEVKVPNQFQIGKRGAGDKINPKDIGC